MYKRQLSYIVLRPVECCTVFEITPVMFFSRGQFIPAATVADRAQARTPDAVTERIDDSTIALTFAVPGGVNMPPILTTTTYTWDEGSDAVIAEDQAPATEETVGGDANGRWCPTAESNDQNGLSLIHI